MTLTVGAINPSQAGATVSIMTDTTIWRPGAPSYGSLMEAAAQYTAWGYNIVGQTDGELILSRKPRIGVHVVLSIITAGLWLLVLLGVLIFAKPHQVVYRLAADGRAYMVA